MARTREVGDLVKGLREVGIWRKKLTVNLVSEVVVGVFCSESWVPCVLQTSPNTTTAKLHKLLFHFKQRYNYKISNFLAFGF